MMIRNKTLWAEYRKKNKTGYGKGILDYAVAWANAMEAQVAKGKSIAKVAEACEPKDHGITGFMYSAAVQTLAGVWKHGKALNDWHNVRYGHPAGSKGTVNPALLTVG